MAITQKVQIDGFRELEGKLKLLREQFGVKTGGVIYRGLQAGANLIKDEAKRRVPHIPSGYTPERLKRGRRKNAKGRKATPKNRQALLRSNIIAHKIPYRARLADGKPTVLIRVRNRGYERVNGRLRFKQPGSSPGWWWWIEFGTSKRPAQPFMRPAFAAKHGAALNTMRETMRREIEETMAKHAPTRRAA